MTEITFQMLMADLWIICGGMVTLPWCKFLIDILDWHRKPPTIKKAIVLLFALFIPMAVFSLIAFLAYPEAFV